MFNKKSFLLLVFSFATCHASFSQAPDGFGIGAMMGEPTGLSLKKWVSQTRAFDGGVAWSFTENASLHFHADYLFHRFGLFSKEAPADRLPVYFGLGARVKLKEDEGNDKKNEQDDLVGIRFPVGIAYLLDSEPVEFFLEIVPVMDVAPETDFSMNVSFGARYYF